MKIFLSNEHHVLCFDINFKKKTINDRVYTKRTELISTLLTALRIKNKIIYPAYLTTITGLEYVSYSADDELSTLKVSCGLSKKDTLGLTRLDKRKYKREILDLFEAFSEEFKLNTKVLS